MAFENFESTNPLTIKDNSMTNFGFQRSANTPDLMLNIYVQHYQHLQDKLKKLISQKEEIDREIQRRKDVEAFPYAKPSNNLFYGLPPLLSSGSSPLALKFDYTNPEFISANFKDYARSTSSFPVKTEVVVPKVQKVEETKRHLPLEELEEISLEKKIKYECKSESIPQGSESIPQGSDSEKSSQKSPHKPQQSKWKNFPGHIMFAIKKGCQNFFDSEKGIRLACIHKILEQEPEYQHKFLQFIEKYKGVWKTYRTIAQYIKDEGDDKIHAMLKTMISELLLDENNKDFEEWLEETRMTEKTKQSIQKGKAVVRKEFLTRLQ